MKKLATTGTDVAVTLLNHIRELLLSNLHLDTG
jgi:hypothetical protein